MMMNKVFLQQNNCMDYSNHFSAVPDPHDRRKIDPLLTDILGLAIIGCICGCVGFEDIEEFGEVKQEGVISDLRFIDSVQRRTQCCRVIRIISHRTISDTTTTETRYYISSRQHPAAFFQNAIRSH